MSEPGGGAVIQRTGGAPLAPDGGGHVRELLAFELGMERYALPLSCVREIVRVPVITEVPRSPDEVLGVISVRGAVTTLIDLRRKLRVDQPLMGGKSRVLLVDHGGEVLGILVDSVLQVHRLQPEEIELASVLGPQAPPYLLGIGRPAGTADAGEILLLLDPSALLRS